MEKSFSVVLLCWRSFDSPESSSGQATQDDRVSG